MNLLYHFMLHCNKKPSLLQYRSNGFFSRYFGIVLNNIHSPNSVPLLSVVSEHARAFDHLVTDLALEENWRPVCSDHMRSAIRGRLEDHVTGVTLSLRFAVLTRQHLDKFTGVEGFTTGRKSKSPKVLQTVVLILMRISFFIYFLDETV